MTFSHVERFTKLKLNKKLDNKRSYIAMTADETHFFAGNDVGEIEVYEKGTWERVKTLKFNDKSIYNMLIDHEYIYVASADHTVTILNKKDHECVMQICDHEKPVRGLAVNGRYLATGGYDEMVFLYAKEGWEKCIEMTHHKDVITDLKMDDNFLYSCSFDASLMKWEIDTNKYWEFKEPRGYDLRRIAILENVIVVGDHWGCIHVIEKETGRVIKQLSDMEYMITGIVIAGKFMFVSVMNRPCFHVYVVDSFSHVAKVDINGGCLGCNCDGEYLYFGHEDRGGIEIWDVKEFVNFAT
ncbi:MAG: hypothetical protein ACTSXU_13525 [Promethearchaeota archaeon]